MFPFLVKLISNFHFCYELSYAYKYIILGVLFSHKDNISVNVRAFLLQIYFGLSS